jgi:hypothetical protein
MKLFDLDVAGVDSGQLSDDVPLDPGEYLGGMNVTLSENYTITVDYSIAPEPRITVLIALGMILLVASKARKRLRPVAR